jgi:hypothetical protein
VEIIRALGAAIEESWRRQRLDERCFPDIVVDTLKQFRPQDALDPTDIVRWFIQTQPINLPRQVNIEATFGEPPITLYSGTHFYIEALYWLDGTTSVHQHGFSGAFQVIAGSSIHTTFEFDISERINSRMMLGDLRLVDAELLSKGSVRHIRAGNALIHSLFHLDRPSVTLVVRTYGEPDAQPQWNYLRPHMAVDPFYKQEWLTRLLQSVDMLHHSESPQLLELVEDAVRAVDFTSAWMVLERFASLRPNATDDLERVLEVSRETHGSLAERFRPVLAEQRRQRHITTRRNRVRNPEHRFFLAALLNLQTNRHIRNFIAVRYPDQNASDLVIRWLRELSEPDSNGIDEATPKSQIGFEFGEGELEIFRLLFAGHSPDRVVGLLSESYDVSEEASNILVLAKALQESLLFQPVFIGQ